MGEGQSALSDSGDCYRRRAVCSEDANGERQTKRRKVMVLDSGSKMKTARLLFLLWALTWGWMTIWQYRRQGWGWAIGNSIVAMMSLGAYVEIVIEDIKTRTGQR